jgi:hypothetical protein
MGSRSGDDNGLADATGVATPFAHHGSLLDAATS